MRWISVGLLLVAVTASCSSVRESTGSGDSIASDDSVPATDAVATTPPSSETRVPPTSPPATDPPGTEPPVTQPLETDPPVTEPPATDPPPPRRTPTGATVVVHADWGGFADSQWTPIGWWDGSTWQTAGFDETGAEIAVPVPTLSSVSATGLALPGGVSTGHSYGPFGTFCVDERTGPRIDLGVQVPEPAVGGGYSVVAVAADWPLQPRPVVEAGIEAEIYQEVGESLADASKVDPADGDVVQVVRADLDGDGVEEVLVTFEHVTSDFGADGDFSIVYARYPESDGTVVDEVLFEYYPDEPVDFPTPGRSSILGVADLNGDGVMEVIRRESFWEYGGAVVHALDDGTLTEVMNAGCGV